jgi:hypothetical protein
LANDEENVLDSLLLTQCEVDNLDLESGQRTSPLERRRATNRVLIQAIEELAEKDETEAKVLDARFVQGLIIRDVANRLYASTDQVNRWQRMAIKDLAQILYSRELTLREERYQRMESSLPAPPYTRLFGFDDMKRQGVQQLLVPEDAWVLTIVGIGGIGKTSLADAIVRDVLTHMRFDEVLWLRVSGQPMSGQPLGPEELFEQLTLLMVERLLPDSPPLTLDARSWQLRQVFSTRPHLVVVDNLETDENTTHILSAIREFIEPTKFVITSRSRPAVGASSFILCLEELEWQYAAELLRYHAQSIGLSELAEANDETIDAVFQVTGGNPLALKMVASLATVLPLPTVLRELGHGRSGPIEELYRNIYWRAWRTLSTDARSLLQAMPLVSDAGALPEQLVAISGLSETSLWPAVTELVSRSLLEVRGSLNERRYGIHRLTDTFLRTEIINWD